MKIAVCIRRDTNDSLSAVTRMAQAQLTRPGQQAEYATVPGGALAIIRSAEANSGDEFFHRDPAGSWIALTGLPATSRDSLAAILKEGCRAGPDRFLARARDFNGGFAAVHWDQPSGSLSVINDVLGLQPLYLHAGENLFLLATDLRGMAASGLIALQADPAAWGGFLGIGYVLNGRTSLRSVERLTGATILRFDPAAWRRQHSHYWSLPEENPVERLEEVDTGALLDILRQEIRAYARHKAGGAVLLSGGFDSRLILSLLQSEKLDPQAIIVSHGDELFDADGRFARQLARRLGVPARFYRFKGFFSSRAFLDYLVATDVSVPSYALFIAQLAQAVAAAQQVVWEGLGPGHGLAAPSFSGVDMNDIHAFARALHKPPGAPRWRAAQLVFRKELAQEMYECFSRDFEREITACGEGYFGFRRFSLRNRVPNRTGMPPYKVYANDALTYTPGIGRDFWHMVFTLPLHLLAGGRLYGHLYRRHFPAAAAVPFCSNGRIVTLNPGLHWRSRLTARLSRLAEQRRVAGLLRRLGLDSPHRLDLVREIVRSVDPADPDLNPDTVRRLQKQTRFDDPVSREALLTVFYWQVWRSVMGGKLRIPQATPVPCTDPSLPVRL